MLCPYCGKTLDKGRLIRKNVKTAERTAVAYDAVCPFCFEYVGRYFWGVFTPVTVERAAPPPEAAKRRPPAAQARRSEDPAPAQSVPDRKSVV